MDGKNLDIIASNSYFGDLANEHFTEIVRLARLGLWADKHGISALKHSKDFCLCRRVKTTGFDYSEEHPRMGKPKTGARWLTPFDLSHDALMRLPKEGA